jgi:signal transduction histidine kinase
MNRATSLSAALTNAFRQFPGTTWMLIWSWSILVGGYALASLTVAPGPRLTAFADIAQCLAAIFACVGLLSNWKAPEQRTRIFFALIALGCGTWLAGQVMWTYYEVVIHKDVLNQFQGDILIFLHSVPIMAAVALKPHDRREDLNVHTGRIDLLFLLVWWVYLYLFVVIPWQYVTIDTVRYGWGYNHLAAIENAVLTLGFAVLLTRAKGAWNDIYSHLFSASLLYAIGSYVTNQAITTGTYYSGSAFDLPIVASFLWFGTAGIVAHCIKPHPDVATDPHPENKWVSRVARMAILSIPLMAIWCLWLSSAAQAVRVFRIGVTQIALVVVALLLYFRQQLVDRDRMRLLEESRKAYEHLKHFQTQMVQTEKLVSLGQLAAGAAHEINNPLTGILGYSEILADDQTLGERQRALAEKVRTLAKRIRALVTNLLSFARRVPFEKIHLDVNHVLDTALHLSNLDLRAQKIDVEVISDAALPPIYGDANQVLQVFFNLISNAADALEEGGGGSLVVRTVHKDSKVAIEFSDTGPGIKSPSQVFDPFFTTKPVGKGTGLGLSICYGIVQEHNGTITCFNRPEGGATFVVTFPVAGNAAPSDEKPVAVVSSVD